MKQQKKVLSLHLIVKDAEFYLSDRITLACKWIRFEPDGENFQEKMRIFTLHNIGV